MHADMALARGISREIKRRREEARSEDPRSTFWTDRDVARRMTEACHPMAHPAVIRAREGRRTISAHEWLTFAHVLSVAPLSLLAPGNGEPVEVAGHTYPVDDVAAWLGGVRPLPSIENPGIYYATAGGMRTPEGSYFASTLRTLADHFDTSEEQTERREVLVHVAGAALDRIRADDWAKRHRDTRKAVSMTKGTTPRGRKRE